MGLGLDGFRVWDFGGWVWGVGGREVSTEGWSNGGMRVIRQQGHACYRAAGAGAYRTVGFMAMRGIQDSRLYDM